MKHTGNGWYLLSDGTKVHGKIKALQAQTDLDAESKLITHVIETAGNQWTPEKPQKDKVIILGFAPDTRDLAPIEDDSFDLWALNELYLDMPKVAQNAAAWFQLHGYEPPDVRDKEQPKNLSQLNCPVYMWGKHRDIPNSVEYPLTDILKRFDIYGEGMAPDVVQQRDRSYFTNSISWMTALAIHKGYKEIWVYGVNMAQTQEYEKQRPSCEYFLGFARGAGIKLYLPPQSDLLRSWMLYGYDDGSPFMAKLHAREIELTNRRNAMLQEAQNARQHTSQMEAQANQLLGALEDNKYMQSLAVGHSGSSRGIDAEVSSDSENSQSD